MDPERDGPKDDDGYRPRPLMGPTFWIMLALGLVCVLAGAGVAMFLPKLMPPPPPAASEAGPR